MKMYLLLLETINLFLNVACNKGGSWSFFKSTVIFISVFRPTVFPDNIGSQSNCYAIMINMWPVCSPSEILSVHLFSRKVQYVNVICFCLGQVLLLGDLWVCVELFVF